MKRFTLSNFVLAVVCLAGCAGRPSREELLSIETECLRCYCASNALEAEAALRKLERYARRCQSASVTGIQYEEVFGRIYGRLYLLERRLGNSKAAEECLEQYAHFHGISSSLARRTGWPHGEMEKLIEHKFDDGLQIKWKSQ
jgi:hypothetical protein